MIISHKHKFIFIHCRKVAGSSMKVELAKYLGDDDIIIGSLHEIIRSNIRLPAATRRSVFTGRGLSTLALRILKGVSFPEALNTSAKYKYFNLLSKNPAHPSAALIRSAFPEEWATYYKFAFVRNPYDQLVSDYLWRKHSSGRNVSFCEYLQVLRNGDTNDPLLHRDGVSNVNMVTINGAQTVDFLGRFERLHEDFKEVGHRIGLEGLELRSHQKAGSARKSYLEYYGSQEKELADALVSCELDLFGYAYPNGER